MMNSNGPVITPGGGIGQSGPVGMPPGQSPIPMVDPHAPPQQQQSQQQIQTAYFLSFFGGGGSWWLIAFQVIVQLYAIERHRQAQREITRAKNIYNRMNNPGERPQDFELTSILTMDYYRAFPGQDLYGAGFAGAARPRVTGVDDPMSIIGLEGSDPLVDGEVEMMFNYPYYGHAANGFEATVIPEHLSVGFGMSYSQIKREAEGNRPSPAPVQPAQPCAGGKGTVVNGVCVFQ